MDTKSEYLLLQVDPDLCKVLRKASQEPQSFRVLQGIRTKEQQASNVKKGVSWTMNSRHLGGKDGLADAVDVVALTNGKIDWAAGREETVYGAIYKQIREAADELKIPIVWGGHWKKRDYGHFELPWSVDRDSDG